MRAKFIPPFSPKDYRCAECAKCFVQKSSLVTHWRAHTGERPYGCELCPATFGDVSCYSKHKFVHSGDRPYTCDKSFTQSCKLHRHECLCVLAQRRIQLCEFVRFGSSFVRWRTTTSPRKESGAVVDPCGMFNLSTRRKGRIRNSQLVTVHPKRPSQHF
ncbi:hypothetical protein HPB50_017848 [Hyalomma asiaticum]|uniref:Uncharacterized protein n=1 Tax=Hyalomma asiaticum TaxID=266040 RepID=A0ACB7SJ21_HYAAI|nr:hypothetical protein HPB50_017848 [Hyalomma asiaticum]